MKYIYGLVKRIILSFSILYAYNIFMVQYDLPIPLNIYTLLFTVLFKIPGFIGLLLFYMINY